jgi:hypothetical protein
MMSFLQTRPPRLLWGELPLRVIERSQHAAIAALPPL